VKQAWRWAPGGRYAHTRGPWQIASLVGFVAFALVIARLALDAGIVWDEDSNLEYGNRALAWLRSFGADRSALTFYDLYLYGGLFDVPAQAIVSRLRLPWGAFETRHMLSALVAALGVLGSAKTASALAGSRAGFLAGLMLALTPVWLGHGLFNPKDIPFAAGAAFVSYSSVCIARQKAPLSWTNALKAGVFVGLALGVRPGGMFLLSYPAIAAFARLGLDGLLGKPEGRWRRLFRDAGRIAARLLVGLIIAWALMIATWPWGQIDPIRNPLSAASIASQFAWHATMLFDGAWVFSDQLPARYLVTWFALALPETYLVATACACLACARFGLERRSLRAPAQLAIAMLVLQIVLPLIGVIVFRPVNFDAQRHFLFLLPPLAALAGTALDWAWTWSARRRARRAVGTIAFALTLALVLYDLASLHPYEYVYFNRISGGLQAAQGRYETDYWGASYREGFAWVVNHLRTVDGSKLRVTTCDATDRMRYYLYNWRGVHKDFEFVTTALESDIVLTYTRSNCDQRFWGPVVHRVERQGVPLLFVFAPRPDRIGWYAPPRTLAPEVSPFVGGDRLIRGEPPPRPTPQDGAAGAAPIRSLLQDRYPDSTKRVMTN
jgi:4-amino-4-deoxy-L-arabinose transferase-like glycosyltransferase